MGCLLLLRQAVSVARFPAMKSIFKKLPLLVVLVHLVACGERQKDANANVEAVAPSDVLDVLVPDLGPPPPSPPVKEDYVIPPGHVAASFSEWIPEFKRVDLVLYDSGAERGPLVQEGRLHQGVVSSMTTSLNDKEVAKLEKLVTGSWSGGIRAACYMPHHGFVFYGQDEKIVGHLEVCLMCRNYHAFPREGLSDNWDLEGIKELIREKKLPVYGGPGEWEEYFDSL